MKHRSTRRIRLVLFAAAIALGAPAGLLAQRPPRPPLPPTPRGWLGISVSWPETAEKGRADLAAVVNVYPGSPADRAGLAPGDTLVTLNGRPASEETHVRLARTLKVGDTVRIKVRRGGREREVSAVAGARAPIALLRRPGAVFLNSDALRSEVRVFFDSARAQLEGVRIPAFRVQQDDSTFTFFYEQDGRWVQGMRLDRDSLLAHMDSLGRAFQELRAGMDSTMVLRLDIERNQPLLRRLGDETVLPGMEMVRIGHRAVAGAEFTELNPGLAEYFEAKEGLLVLRVARRTPAARAGLEPGDVVRAVDGAPVRTPADLRRAIVRSREESVRLDVLRKGKPRELRLERRR